MPSSQSEQQPFKPRGVFEYLLTHYRGIFATTVLIPVSLVFGWYIRLRAFAVRCRYSAPELHDSRVKRVVEQLRRWEEEGAPVRLTTSRSGWFSMSQYVAAYKKTNRAIEMPMYDIIAINDEKGTVTVQPLVNMGQLSRALNAKGWTLAVVPELDALTVGGLINGFGVESSSHKYGLFQYIVESVDLVTPDGQLRHCSPTENAELFFTVPWSHGTLGFLVAAELKMIRCQPFVRLEYRALRGLSTIVSEFEKAARDTGNEFVEMLQYGCDEAVLMTGRFAAAPQPDGTKNSIGRWYKPWFYTHARRVLTRPGPVVEYIPLRHYYHRHTRGLFWEMGEVIPFGNHPLFRFLLGWALPPEISLMKYCETQTTERLREKYHVVQDMLVPVSALLESLRYLDTQYQLYPLWICPMAVRDYPRGMGFLHSLRTPEGGEDTLFVDIGMYGSPKVPGFDGNAALEALEQFVLDRRGYQAMYAKTLLTREQFRAMFDHTTYDRLRKEIRLCEEAFPEVYDKLGGGARLSPVAYKRLKATRESVVPPNPNP